jgi:hypothetical protein
MCLAKVRVYLRDFVYYKNGSCFVLIHLESSVVGMIQLSQTMMSAYFNDGDWIMRRGNEGWV